MPLIDVAYAWRLVRDARGRDWGTPQTWSIGNAATLRIAPGGAWETAAAVAAPAAALFDALLPVVARPGPCAIGQLGQSLDGRIATASGHSHYVTGEASRIHLHRLRALVDAVIVGAGTAAADNPRLTVRHVEGASPVRVVLDPAARVPATSRVFTEAAAPTLHVVHRVRDSARAAHVQALPLPADAGGLDPRALLAALAERGLFRVLVEGGGVTVSRFLQAEALDRLHVVVAPLLVGSGRPALTLPEIETLADARRPVCGRHRLGDDVLFDLAVTPTR